MTSTSSPSGNSGGTGRMHPAPSLAEAFPRPDDPRSGQQRPRSPDDAAAHYRQSHSNSPPMRKDTNSSTSTNATVATLTSGETVATSFSVESSPTFSGQPIFSINDDAAEMAYRRANRRRTGPLSAEQREKAAIIRKLGACKDCRRRRVACNPTHHNMTWEDAVRKYRSHSPNLQELAPNSTADRPVNHGPAPINSKPLYANDHQDIMDLDHSPSSQQPGRPPLSETRYRTPLPSGPRLEKTAQAVMALPGIDSLKSDLQETASRILSNPNRTRYSAVHGLLLFWQEEEQTEVRQAVEELHSVFDEHYHYTFEVSSIPKSFDEDYSSRRWLSRIVTDFVDDRDQRDVLKIVYYNGHTCLDGNRDMVLSPSKHTHEASTIRWNGIQKILEDAKADTLILMDAAYYASERMVRKRGVLELIAAGASDEHIHALGRSTFTRALTDSLRKRAGQHFTHPFSAAGLHACLLSDYTRMIRDPAPDREIITSFPAPLHLQVSGSNRLPSIVLAPLRGDTGSREIESPVAGPQLSLTVRLTDDALNMESWAEWFRSMPEGCTDVKVEGPFRNIFR